jgi:hypothetical protein
VDLLKEPKLWLKVAFWPNLVSPSPNDVMCLMELYGNDFSAEIIHEYYTSLKVKEWFTKGHTEETFKVAVIHYPIGHSDHTNASHLPRKNLMCLA